MTNKQQERELLLAPIERRREIILEEIAKLAPVGAHGALLAASSMRYDVAQLRAIKVFGGDAIARVPNTAPIQPPQSFVNNIGNLLGVSSFAINDPDMTLFSPNLIVSLAALTEPQAIPLIMTINGKLPQSNVDAIITAIGQVTSVAGTIVLQGSNEPPSRKGVSAGSEIFGEPSGILNGKPSWSPQGHGTGNELWYNGTRWVKDIDGVNDVVASVGTEAFPWLATWPGITVQQANPDVVALELNGWTVTTN